MLSVTHLASGWDVPNFEQLKRQPLDTGSGRGVIQLVSHPKGVLVERQYRHGGLRRLVAASLFLKTRRPANEFEMHRKVFLAGLATVEPVGWREEGTGLPLLRRYFYCTAKLDDAMPFPQFLREGGDMQRYIGQGANLLHGLFKLGIFHVDLNLNNWLIQSGGLYLIDFDKARDVDWSAEDYLQRVVERIARSGRKLGFSSRKFLFLRFLVRICQVFDISPRRMVGKMKQSKHDVTFWERFRWKLSGGHQFSS